MAGSVGGVGDDGDDGDVGLVLFGCIFVKVGVILWSFLNGVLCKYGEVFRLLFEMSFLFW